MKSETTISAEKVRTVALFVLAIGIVVAALFVMLGIFSVFAKNILSGSKNQLEMAMSDFYYSMARLGGIRLIIRGVLVYVVTYVLYVLISAYSTIVANSDRTAIVDALNNINETMKNSNKNGDSENS